MFPNKASQLPHHKFNVGEYEILRFSAIYGANGAGKSNLIKSIALLKSIVKEGKIEANVNALKFKLDDSCLTKPVSLAIEFYFDSKIFYYTITFDEKNILYEYLADTTNRTDSLIFERTIENGVQKIQFPEENSKDKKEKYFVEFVEKLIDSKEVLLTFLSKKYSEDFENTKQAYKWFTTQLIIIDPQDVVTITPYLVLNPDTKKFANQLVSTLNTGIAKIDIETQDLDEFSKEDVKRITNRIKTNSFVILTDSTTGESVTVVSENDKIVSKKLIIYHKNDKGNLVELPFNRESDGTQRLFEYIPLFEDIINSKCVYLIDEIERSIHPLMIKELIKKMLLNENIKGQLIFTTHESNLLDQKILRPDEIWFAQKDNVGGSRFYSLSDYNISNSVDIENGYLNGRFGGIPFLSNLKELNWQ
ncbi:MAG: ATP-binding protein [Planctomycetaceae bacterium]|nr:ATP-binding protein [Planctomycetaceae bacterium]